MTRDSSPPDAILASRRGGSPGFGANMKRTESAPEAPRARALEPLPQRRERGIELGERRELARHGGEALRDRAVPGVERVLAARGGREEPLGAPQPFAQRAQLVVLAGHGLGGVELAQLETQQVLALGAAARVGRESLERAPRLRELGVRRGHLGAGVLVLREGVEDRELALGIGERLLIVLGGDVDEARDVLREVARRREATTEVRAAPSLPRDHAPHDEPVV